MKKSLKYFGDSNKSLTFANANEGRGRASSRETGLGCDEGERIFPRSVAEVKIIFVPLQSRSLHEWVRLLRGQDSEKWGEITRSLRSLIYNKLCSARHEFLGNKR